jgi:hypothetical protein
VPFPRMKEPRQRETDVGLGSQAGAGRPPGRRTPHRVASAQNDVTVRSRPHPGQFGLALATALWLAAASAVADENVTVQLRIRDGRFDPQTIDVPSATRVRLLIRNEGPGASEFESRELHKEKVLGPGAQSFIVIAPLAPGTYPFFDDFHPDTGNGRIVAR